MNGTFGKRFQRNPRFWNVDLNSLPHILTRWASSTAMKETLEFNSFDNWLRQKLKKEEKRTPNNSK
jgi:hypothetical protein